MNIYKIGLDLFVVGLMGLFFLLGFLRGSRKSLKSLIVNLVIIAIAFFGAIYLTEFAKNQGFTVDGQQFKISELQEFFKNRTDDFSISLSQALEGNEISVDALTSFALAFSRVFIFIALLIILFVLKIVIGILIFPFKLFFRKKRKGSKKRLLGGAFGATNGLAISMAILIPVVGINHTIQEVAKVESLNEKYNLSDYDLFGDTYLSKYVGEIPLKLYDELTKFKLDGESYYVRHEIETLIKVYQKFETLGFGTEGYNFFKDEEAEDKIDGIVDIIKDLDNNKIFKSILPIAISLSCSMITMENLSCDTMDLESVNFAEINFGNEAASLGEALKVIISARDENYNLGIKSFNTQNLGEIFKYFGQSELVRTLMPALLGVVIEQMGSGMELFGNTMSELLKIQELQNIFKNPQLNYETEGKGIGALSKVIGELMNTSQDSEEQNVSISITEAQITALKKDINDAKAYIDSSEIINVILPGILMILINNSIQGMNIGQITSEGETLILSAELIGVLSLLEIGSTIENPDGTQIAGIIKTLGDSDAILVKRVVSKLVEQQASALFNVADLSALGIDLSGENIFNEAATIGALVDLSTEISKMDDISKVDPNTISKIFEDLDKANKDSDMLSKIIPAMVNQNAGGTEVVPIENYKDINYADEGNIISEAVKISQQEERTTTDVAKVASDLAESTLAINTLVANNATIEVTEDEKSEVIADYISKGYIVDDGNGNYLANTNGDGNPVSGAAGALAVLGLLKLKP